MNNNAVGCVSVWAGATMSASDADAYMEESYADDVDCVSRFARAFHIVFYDHDFLEVARFDQPVPAQDALHGVSYVESFRDSAAVALRAALPDGVGLLILLYDFDYRVPEIEYDRATGVRYIGTFQYAV